MPEELTPEPMDPMPPFTPEEIKALARNWVTNVTYVRFVGDPGFEESFGMMFMFMKTCPPNVVGCYEDYHKANPMSVNGWPTFFSLKMIPEESAQALCDTARQMYEALK